MAVGFVNQVYPREEFENNCEEFIYRLTSNSGAILRLTKKAIKQSLGRPFSEGLDISEQIYLKEMMATKDAHEGLKAFMEKRQAQWADE